MRLWHQKLIPYLPDKQLGGQWCEIRMILGTITKRGKVNHSTVNYVNKYPIHYLYAYGIFIAEERIKRGMYCNPVFIDEYYENSQAYIIAKISETTGRTVYPEHDDEYLEECLLNLEAKGIYLRKVMHGN